MSTPRPARPVAAVLSARMAAAQQRPQQRQRTAAGASARRCCTQPSSRWGRGCCAVGAHAPQLLCRPGCACARAWVHVCMRAWCRPQRPWHAALELACTTATTSTSTNTSARCPGARRRVQCVWPRAGALSQGRAPAQRPGAHTHAHTRTHTHTCTHAHMHTCIRARTHCTIMHALHPSACQQSTPTWCMASELC
jgi:hypothetical protein